MLLRSTAANSTSATEPKQKFIASDQARKFKESLAGFYTTTDTIFMRSGAGTKHNTMTILPQGTVVKCRGSYSVNGTVKWLYVQFTTNNAEYMGFCSSKYLRK